MWFGEGVLSGRREVVRVGIRSRVGRTCVSCSVSIVISHTLPSIHSKFGPIRHHMLCNVHGCAGRGPCGGSTHVINSIVNRCRPRNSSSVCVALIHVTRR